MSLRTVSYEKLVGVNANALSSACIGLKFDITLNESEESIITSDSNAVTGMDLGASLSYDDVTGDNMLSAELLDTETLGLTVTAVLGRTNTLLMCKEL